MNRKIDLLVKGIKNPIKTVHYVFTLVDNKFKLTETAKASGGGERLVIKDWQSEKISMNFSALAHLQRYDWVLPCLKNLCCLDDGCGSGYGTYHLAKNGISAIIGVDISFNGIKFAKKKYNVKNLEFIQMDALNLKFKDNSFDAVISFDILEHIDEEYQSKFISEIARVLKDEGAVYIGCPNAKVSMGQNMFHLKELTMRDFEFLLKNFFEYVKIFGQDLLVNDIRQKENWHKCLSDLSYQNLIIVEEDCDLTYGLLAICKGPKNLR